ncbi:hypothetical protein [Salinicoccus sp. HZC-1]|uniref:hypothetical protein n=1 Tax=Salinicoccus sp. HZC-1 TaxID=3385497 RepID=UPI00398B4787
MKTAYDKDNQAAYQRLEIEINASQDEIFYYLGTTEDISQWFPQLSFSKNENIHTLRFNLGDGTFSVLHGT